MKKGYVIPLVEIQKLSFADVLTSSNLAVKKESGNLDSEDYGGAKIGWSDWF